jgi:hypothetical protein
MAKCYECGFKVYGDEKCGCPELNEEQTERIEELEAEVERLQEEVHFLTDKLGVARGEQEGCPRCRHPYFGTVDAGAPPDKRQFICQDGGCGYVGLCSEWTKKIDSNYSPE